MQVVKLGAVYELLGWKPPPRRPDGLAAEQEGEKWSAAEDSADDPAPPADKDHDTPS